MRKYRFYLKDIYEAMSAVQAFVKGMDFSAFVVDDKTSSAVIYKLEIIGESAKNIPDTIQELYPQVPWQQMIEMGTGSFIPTLILTMRQFGKPLKT